MQKWRWLSISTRSYICKENEDGTYTGIYCHSDGYLTYNGAMLIDHYKDREKVEKLISLGDMSSLNVNVDPDTSKEHNFDNRQEDVCVFYGRDRGEKDTEAQIVNPHKFNSSESMIEYCYIYGLDNKWKYFECGRSDKINLEDVEKALEKEYKRLGFPRPANRYGFYFPDEIEAFKNKANEEAEM